VFIIEHSYLSVSQAEYEDGESVMEKIHLDNLLSQTAQATEIIISYESGDVVAVSGLMDLLEAMLRECSFVLQC
jgi:hypothetical protein